ncbi:hypothetical protein SEA_GILDA_44 [Microbacterium phage Gilda]|uniref:Uncharacterized protein n=6 Tax=Krampusvirus krampus TaxID=2734242 RepID=A0A2Z4Q367_9CAUD|nr:hypothetical protein HOT40_gp44 [Microbacterium phage Krampus]AWY04500.1 hypothetical protein SEA_ANNASERENA_44 [Microbacterium phage AnnaSerena]QCQ57406.1 hypothetical protein SEA_RACHELLA_44 [Microbacterium phage Rachella]QDF18096.1 hypothetical protein SEA_ANAKIN_44 [Microbacterium phage Anakin]QDF18178.1 hypothetical protein SEA_NARUTORUN_44 [Microbacterium phage NarutoRun]QGH73995.1 hypothetical protein SEA_HIDDENLEAF_44 [Microbacterium phage Hiddenleaf]QLF84367.1 hypothetical protein
MKSILEAAPAEIGAIKKRTIRSLAMGQIEEKDCDFINNHLDAILKRVSEINEGEEG